MSEKILGFYKKDAIKSMYNHIKWGEKYNHKEGCHYILNAEKLVPVRLASESVGLEELRKLRSKRLKEMLDRDEERGFGNGYLCAIDEVIELAVKEAKRND